MQIEPMKFREFTPDTPPPVVIKPTREFVTTGRFKGEVIPPPPPPTFSEEQLKEAEREAYKKGFLEGEQEGRKQAETAQAEADRQLAAMTEQFGQAVAPLLADYRTTITELKTEMPKVALAIARKVAGQALADNAASMVEDIALRCVEAMAGEPKLAITVHQSLVERLERHMQQLATHLRSATDIQVIGNETLPVENCRIEWKHGNFVRNTESLWQEIERVVATMVASAAHDAKTQLTAVEATLPNPSTPSQKE